ncbi:TPA: restriction endonuclease subunit S [Pseudomonas aeruginosa]|uniref:restriction endonuclease subunit S n=1 Tax=Pseudomonas aeruginosa group TaxID=136841 RepID=UPI0015E68331|nr:restriction endonuclease subunit S [Pseudomonas aeruginosa]
MSDKNNKTLKPGWRRVKFGDVVRLSKARSQDPLADGIERYVGLEHLEPGDLRIRSWGSVADGVTFTSVFQPGQVLFGKRRAYQRKVAIADFSGVCSGDIYVLETKDAQVLLPELLPFICQTDTFFDHAVGTSAGSLSPRTNWTSLANYEFTLPPIEEQTRLLEALTAIENTCDAYTDSLAKSRQILANIRDRVLWEGEGQSLHDTSIGSIPVGWQAKQLGEVVEFLGGTQPPASVFEFAPSPTNVRLIQIRDYKSDEFATYIPLALAKKFCSADDVMIGRYGPPVFQILRGLEGAYNVALIKAKPKDGLEKGYLYHYLKEQALLQLIEGLSRRSSGQSGVDMDKLKAYPIPLPPLETQQRLSRLFDSMESSLESIRSRLSALIPLREQILSATRTA